MPEFDDQARLISLLNALLRYLLHYSPSYAEAVWCAISHAPAENSRWIEVRSPIGPAWYFFGADGTARYSATRPANADNADIVVAKEYVGPRCSLRHRYEWLVSNVWSPEAQQRFEQITPLLYRAGDGQFEPIQLWRFIDGCRKALRGSSAPDTTEGLSSHLERYTETLGAGFEQYHFPGYFVGLMTLLNLAWRDAVGRVLNDKQFGSANVELLGHLVLFACDRIVEHEGPGRIEQAAKTLHNNGSRMIEEAREAGNEIDFYDRIFRSCPSFYGAKCGYRYLAQHKAASSEQKARFSGMADACGASLATASASLFNAFYSNY